MQVNTVGVEYRRKFNLGNYQSLELGISLYAKVDPDKDSEAVAEFLWQQAKASVKAQAAPVLNGVNYQAQVQYKGEWQQIQTRTRSYSMLDTASYFENAHHHGKLISISRSVPKGFKVDGFLEFLALNAQLLKDWKDKSIDEAEYCERYRLQLKESWQQVSSWLKSLDNNTTTTLLCYEPSGAFCHRNLIAKLVTKHCPDVFGGCDIKRIEIPKCNSCQVELIVGLDSCFCPSCRTWKRSQ